MIDGELRFPVMGSEAHVCVLGGAADLVDQARDRLVQLERRWSRFLPDSEVSALNRSEGRPRIVSAETFEVVSAAVEAWRWSGGHFDPTTAATMTAAGYDHSIAGSTLAPTVPTHVACATPAGIVLDPYPRSITVPPGVTIDLGGIGKGAAADLVATELLRSGADGCCVNVGGDLRVAGRPPRPTGWRIDVDLGPDIDRPVIGLADGSICTSTVRRRTWITAIGPEHHLRDPGDGRPFDTGLATVTVIGAEARQGEVLTKAAFAAGVDRGAELITATGATGFLVTDDGRVVELDGLAPFLAAGAAPSEAIA